MENNDDKVANERKATIRIRLIIWTVIGLLIGVAPLFALSGQYGFVLFLTVPFSVGLCASLLKSMGRAHRFREFMFMLLFPVAALLVLFLVMGKEGFMCVLMASPIVIGFLLIGITIGFVIQERLWSKYMAIVFVFLLNGCTMIYDTRSLEFTTSVVQTEITIHASQEKVWNQLVHHFEFGDADNFFLAHGVSYPKEMEVRSSGGCNSLFCTYSNGNIVANIDSLVTNQLMRFSFHDAPVSMKETSLYSDVEPKHIRGRILVDYGSFRIVPLANGNVKVIATSQFKNSLGPQFYWNWWESYLLNKIHEHVLEKLKEKSEGN